MNKSKWIAIISSVFIFSTSCLVYAQTTPDSPPALIVSRPVQPISSIAPSGALHVPFTKVDLFARGEDMVVDDITVVKSGPSDDEAFDDILLIDPEGEEVGEGSLDDDHTVHFTDPISIPRNTTLHLTVAANMADDLTEFDGQVAVFTITSIIAHGYIPVE